MPAPPNWRDNQPVVAGERQSSGLRGTQSSQLHGTQSKHLRGTQSMIGTISRCLRRPLLLVTEIGWRWCAGIPTVWLVWHAIVRISNSTSLAQTGIDQFSLLDQTHAAAEVMRCVELLWPPIVATARWLVPLLMLIWAGASGVGRWLLLSVADKKRFPLQVKSLGTILVLQAMRVIALTGTVCLWFVGMRWVGGWAVVRPMQLAAPDPNIVGFISMLIVLTIGLFTLWAVVSYFFNLAPLLAMGENPGGENAGVIGSLRAALRPGWLRGKLIEINLVLAVVKLALMVLALVLSSTPLPFEQSVSGQDLYEWWMIAMVVYFIASDFYHVVRTVSYAELWGLWRDSNQAPSN
jgi:hypothetical protein